MTYAAVAELAGLPELPTSAFRTKAALERLKVPSRPRSGRGGGVEYLVAALPAKARMAWAARQAGDSAQALAAVPAKAPAASAGVSGREAVLVTGWRKERQDNKARILVLLQRFWQEFGGPMWPAIEAFCQGWNQGGIDTDPALRAAHPRLAPTTVRRWHTDVQAHGLAAVTPPEHHRKGKYVALVGEVGNAMLALLIERPHLSAQSIYAALQTQFKDLPSDRAFRRALAYWKAQNSQALEAAINPDGWRNKFMSAAGSYSQGIVRPNQKWEMDSTVGDVMLADGRRHHVVGVIDVYTRRRMFVVTRTSRANAIMALIRRAILAWGVPEAIKTDNGADYTAQVLESALLGLAIDHPLCAPFAPHEKPHIERAIGSLMHQLFELLDGYIGHSVAERKGIEARRGFAERILKEEITVELRLTPEQLQARIDSYCESRLHEARSYLGNRTPAQMVEGAEGFVPKQVSERALDMLLAPAAKQGTAQVTKKGIRALGGWYNHAHLGGMEGQTVQIRIDDTNLGRGYVFDLDGVFVAEVLDYERLGISSAEVAAKRRAHQTKVVSEQKRELRKLKAGFDTKAAINAIHASRTEEAVASASNVVSLPTPAAVASKLAQHTSVAIASIDAAAAPVVDEAQIAAAHARMAAPRVAVVKPLADTPQQRYARWLKLHQRVQASQALTADERNWFEGYAHSQEHGSMARYFQTFELDADQVLAG